MKIKVKFFTILIKGTTLYYMYKTYSPNFAAGEVGKVECEMRSCSIFSLMAARVLVRTIYNRIFKPYFISGIV